MKKQLLLSTELKLMYSVNHFNFSNVKMTLIALIEWKTVLKLRCWVGTLNEVKSIFFNGPSIKKRKLCSMLCRHFHPVPPWTVISSAPAVPSSWGSGGWQGSLARCEDPHQPPVMPYQALLADAGSRDLSNLWWGAQCPPAWLPPLASHARSCLLCWPGVWSGLFCGLTGMSLQWDLHVPLSGGLLAARVLCTASCWAKAVGPEEIRLYEQESCILSLSFVC